MRMSPRANVLANARLGTCISLSLENFKNFVRRVALFTGMLFILCQQFFNTKLIRPKNNGRTRLRHVVCSWGRIRDGFFYGLTAVSLFTGNLTQSLLLKIVGSAHSFAGFLAYHRLFSF